VTERSKIVGAMTLRPFVSASAGVLVLAVSLLAASPAAADVQVTIQDGKVSVVAKDATLRQIMAEWARVGGTKVVNVERIPGGPMTLELHAVPEDRALEILMRSLSGYLAAPRAVPSPALSKFDRIIVMPTVAAARQPAAAASAAPAPVFQQTPTFQPPVQQDEPDDPPPGQNPAAPRGPVFTAFPQPQVVNPNGAQGNVVPGNGQTFVPPPGMNLPGAAPPQQQAAPTGVPTVPVGVAVPGMMVPTPQPPGVPGQPVPTIRRPGGL
jgi:hypothetical protein